MNTRNPRANGDSALDPESQITLGMLSAVEYNSAVTQRALAHDLDIALGLANAYLKRCIKKGFIKITTAPANRYAYYLTPQGFAEKSRLTARYLSISFNFFRSARGECEALFAMCAERHWNRVALYGAGDLAEIATLCAGTNSIRLVGVVDPTFAGEEFAQLPAFRTLVDAGPLDALVLTDFRAPQESFDTLRAQFPVERILAPDFLKISRAPKIVEGRE